MKLRAIVTLSACYLIVNEIDMKNYGSKTWITIFFVRLEYVEGIFSFFSMDPFNCTIAYNVELAILRQFVGREVWLSYSFMNERVNNDSYNGRLFNPWIMITFDEWLSSWEPKFVGTEVYIKKITWNCWRPLQTYSLHAVKAIKFYRTKQYQRIHHFKVVIFIINMLSLQTAI